MSTHSRVPVKENINNSVRVAKTYTRLLRLTFFVFWAVFVSLIYHAGRLRKARVTRSLGDAPRIIDSRIICRCYRVLPKKQLFSVVDTTVENSQNDRWHRLSSLLCVPTTWNKCSNNIKMCFLKAFAILEDYLIRLGEGMIYIQRYTRESSTSERVFRKKMNRPLTRFSW